MVFVFSESTHSKSWALFFFVLAALTDYWDGWIARTNNQVTNFGKLMDPIADKLLVISALIAFVSMEMISAWAVMAVIARDLLITGVRLLVPSKNDLASARSSGKNKTAIQLIFVMTVLLFLALDEAGYWKEEWAPAAFAVIDWGMLVVVAVTLWSGAIFLYKNREIFQA